MTLKFLAIMASFLTVTLLALPIAHGAQFIGRCTDAQPVLAVTLSAAFNESGPAAQLLTPIYLPLSPQDLDLFPGLKANVALVPANTQPATVAVKLSFDFDKDVITTDYSIFRIALEAYDHANLVERREIDFSDGCASPRGRGIRAGESLEAAKLTVDPSRYSQLRLRIRVWGGMF